MTDQFLNDWKHFIKAAGFSIGDLNHFDELVAPDRRKLQGYITNSLIGRRLMQRYRDIDSFSIDQDAITVDPSSFYVIHVIVNDKFVYGIYQLPVADVGEKIGLHNSKLHNGSTRH